MTFRGVVATAAAASALGGCLLVTHVDDDAFGDGTVASGGDASNEGTLSDASGDGTPSDVAVDGDATVPCPGKHGPAMVRVGAFCIDSTEVRVSDYQEFLAANVDPSSQGASCKFNAFTPGNWTFQQTRPTYPVANVNWCDAVGYCAWAGKHLCGRTGGGGSLASAAIPTTQSEWFFACTEGGQKAYPYGDTYMPQACNGYDRNGGGGTADFVAAGTLTSCEGGFAGLYDMSGNAIEWIDHCTGPMAGDAAANDDCALIGGSIFKSDTNSLMACKGWFYYTRGAKNGADVGFRCCS